MKIYITKHALTQGIVEAEGEQIEDTPKMVKVLPRTNSHYSYYLFKPHWHENKEEAVAQAEKMRLAKIKSLEKQIKKLQNMKF